MKIGVLTSSRADYSIYLPLLKKLKEEEQFDLQIIAFGTHVSSAYGMTKTAIVQDGFEVAHALPEFIYGDQPNDIVKSMGMTTIEVGNIFKVERYDLIFALGDRFEMFAAVSAAVPYCIPIAHIHGGETTEGAIDNVFRHSITSMAKYHFTTTDIFADRVRDIIGNSTTIFNVGALSIDNLKAMELYSKEEMRAKYDLDMNLPSILITVHPETTSLSENEGYIDNLIASLEVLKERYKLIITMPNMDPLGSMIRSKLDVFISANTDATFSIESFGTIGYLSCMKYCNFLLGNTSSGFVDASFFPKDVINLGNRQKGRIESDNIRTVPFDQKKILEAVKQIEGTPYNKPIYTYGQGNTAQKIVELLKTNF